MFFYRSNRAKLVSILTLAATVTSMLVHPAQLAHGQSIDPQLPPDPTDAGQMPATAQRLDEVAPQQAGISDADFVGVFARVKLSGLQSKKSVLQRLQALTNATTAEQAAAQVPAEALAQPDAIAFIETGVLPSTFIVTGESIPPTPAAGAGLFPGLPAPYGLYTLNPTNNWGMPNSPTNGCGSGIFNVPDEGPYFDFSRACRQHDLAYRWKPVERYHVDNRLLTEMLYDCGTRNSVSRRLCGIQAVIYWTAVTLFGGFVYGTGHTPGYNEAGDAIIWPAPTSTCAQASHVWVFTDGYGTHVPRTKPLFFTGVVRRHTRVQFQLIDAAGNIALQHTTHAAYTNCVIRHEPESVSAGLLPNGIYRVHALYTPWETDRVTEVDLGSIEIFTPTGSTTCNQFSHAWVHGTYNGPITVGTVIYPTGVVRRNTSARFDFVNAQGQIMYQATTAPSANNCVIAHEREARSTASWVPGVYQIMATYTEWETDSVVTRQVGTLDLRVGGSGGGDGGGDGDGGGCLRAGNGCTS